MRQIQSSLLRLTILTCLSLANIAFSTATGQDCSSPGTNTCFGEGALAMNMSGIHNSAFGRDALVFNKTGSNNTATGSQVLFNNSSGNDNTANGFLTLYRNITGSFNTAVGSEALFRNIASSNSAFGAAALRLNTTGTNNTATGVGALLTNSIGSANTANGDSALTSNTTGDNNTAIGYRALYVNEVGESNTATGLHALFNNNGSFNTGNGVGTLKNNVTGVRNVAMGYQAGFAVTGSDNIVIGGSNLGKAVENGVIRIGRSANQKKTFIAGIRGVKTGLAAATTVFIDSNGQLGTIKSSREAKENIQPMGSVSERLFTLRPVTFQYKEADDDGGKPVQFGLIAEDVAEAFPELVVYGEDGKPETVSYHLLATLLLNEFQEQATRIAALEQQSVELAQLKKQVAAMAVIIERLDQARMLAATR